MDQSSENMYKAPSCCSRFLRKTKLIPSPESLTKFTSNLRTAITSTTRPPQPPTHFHRFLDLPDELQLKIIHICLAHQRIVTIRRPLSETRRGPSLALNGLQPLRSFTFLQVCHKFRQEGLKTHPLCFPVSLPPYIGVVHKSPAMVRFNLDRDILVIPQYYLQQRQAFCYDLHRVKNLIISWEAPFTTALSLRIVRLFPCLKSIGLVHQALCVRSDGAGTTLSRRDSKQIEKLSEMLFDAAMIEGLVQHLSDFTLYLCYILPKNAPAHHESSESEDWSSGRERVKDWACVRAFEMERLVKKMRYRITDRDWR